MFQKDDLVRVRVDGRVQIERVMSATSAQVVTYESARRLNWYHPTKCTLVTIDSRTGRYMTIPMD